MAATMPTLSFLLFTLFAFFTTGTLATFVNPVSIPSCIGHPTLLKCAHDIQFALIGVGRAKTGADVHAISLVLDSINAAKASYINVLHFLPSNHINSDLIKSLRSACHIGIHELSNASKVLHGKSTVSSSELHKVLNFLKIVNQNVAKLIASLKHPDTSIDLALRSLIDQSINLTALSLKICGELSGQVTVGSKHH